MAGEKRNLSAVHSLEEERDAVLARILDVREKAEDSQDEWAISECARLGGLAQHGQNSYEIGSVAMALDYLELLVNFGSGKSQA